MDIENFKLLDESFNEDIFYSKVSNIFIRMLNAVTLDNLSSIDHFVSDEVYEYISNLIYDAKKKNVIHIYDESNIVSINIEDIEVSGDTYIIRVYLVVRYIDYLMNKETNQIVLGSRDLKITRNYRLEFVKKKNTYEEGVIRKCPGCGNSLDTTSNGKCNYCGSIYNQEDYDWVLNRVK